jgi:solute:Na+ symporter, SSS family
LPARASSTAALAIIVPYLMATVVVGQIVRRKVKDSAQFLHARRALPTWVTALAFVAANCGALEVVGIVTASAKYGALALDFYWIGAIPAMVFLALLMMPVYAQSGAMTMPDYLRLRYGRATHVLSVVSLVVMIAFVSGISLYAISTVLHLFFGWEFFHVAMGTAAVVLCYALSGGLWATIYNELLQFAMTVAGLLPLAWMVYRETGGPNGVVRGLPPEMRHLWTGMPVAAPHTARMDVLGVTVGLAFALSFGYWCTDFVLIQRALAARTEEGSVRTPLLAAVVKLVFPFLLIFPGMAAAGLLRGQAAPRFDEALPLLMEHYYGPALLGLGVAAILASLMSGLAGNIAAFSALATHDLYRGHLRRRASDLHYLRVARAFTLVGACLSVATACIAFRYNNLMDYLQLIFSLFNAPLCAMFVLGMFTTWASPAGGFWGLLCGVLGAAAHNLAVREGWIVYGSQMAANFYGAIYGWAVCAGVTAAVSALTLRKTREELHGLTFFTQRSERVRPSGTAWALAAGVVGLGVAMDWIYR